MCERVNENVMKRNVMPGTKTTWGWEVEHTPLYNFNECPLEAWASLQKSQMLGDKPRKLKNKCKAS